MPPSPGSDDLVLALLSASAPDRALDQRLHALRGTGAAPPYTADPAATHAEARRHGLLIASGARPDGAWASVWLPPPSGDSPIVMYAAAEAQAAAAALAEALGRLPAPRRRAANP